MVETSFAGIGSRPLRPTVAASFLAEVAAAPESRLLAGIVGAGGTGKTVLLDDLEAQYRASGLHVLRNCVDLSATDLDLCTVNARGAVLIDDAHELSDTALAQLASVVEERDVNLVVAYRPWPQPAALSRLSDVLEQHHAPVILGPLSRGEIHARAAEVLEGAPTASLVDKLAEATAGMPWLVHLVMESIGQHGSSALSEPHCSRGLMDQLGYELDKVDGGVSDLLLALSVGFDLAGQIPPALDHAGESLDHLVTRARAAGLLRADGRLVPLVRRAVLAATPPYRVREAQRALVDAFTAEGRSLGDVARGLARGGLRDPRIARALEREGDSVLAEQPALASALYDEAGAAGSDELTTAARRAQAASAVGDLDGAGRILDNLLSSEDAPDLLRGVDVAAATWAQRGMLARSAEVYRWLGADRTGPSAALAAVAMIGTGDREGAETMLKARGPSGSPTLAAVAVGLMGEGISASIAAQPAYALPALIRASDMMTASGSSIPLPEVPAALAALVALHCGEPAVADSVLDDALAGEQAGAAARPRLLLLRAWTAMQLDRPDRARAAITEAGACEGGLAPRDELLFDALEVGLARRTDDTAALVHAWQRARERILHVSVDLYSLLPFGELAVAAARLRDSARLEPQLAEAWALLERLGDPPLWSIPLRWHAVQAAILAERPADLAPHASALVRASGHNHLASVLAAAGRSWVAVLAGRIDVDAVEAAARGLAAVGMTWDGSRLAGHAAPRADERKDMARLLACARDLHPGSVVSVSAETEPVPTLPAVRPAVRPSAGQPAGAGSEGAVLSAREREVARLVLDGKTYREIGAAIFISPRTAEHHIARIRRRLGAATRSELLAQLRLLLGEEASGPP
ncbi:LuxR family transcriptional regulator [Arthrobacter sp. VKM Ac-2550]|uniref:LuxR family transcriptional regulator n=1 Tax=Crystallibacter permensis TaxID=1938888 RepID=UPI00222723C9|nr:LuxR family transcriptional regulator [Arthrobacter sp. VKM Ac-2550]MCW2134683.1 regulatory protein, luxR family [Arthrobacter sp. VKM Ac-2550]